MDVNILNIKEVDIMHGICKECGFEGDCISAENDLCAECDEDIRQCEICKFPCRTLQRIPLF